MPVTQLTSEHIEQLRARLYSDGPDSIYGDRGGFYLLYYQLTGSAQALIQAHITVIIGVRVEFSLNARAGAAELSRALLHRHATGEIRR